MRALELACAHSENDLLLVEEWRTSSALEAQLSVTESDEPGSFRTTRVVLDEKKTRELRDFLTALLGGV